MRVGVAANDKTKGPLLLIMGGKTKGLYKNVLLCSPEK